MVEYHKKFRQIVLHWLLVIKSAKHSFFPREFNTIYIWHFFAWTILIQLSQEGPEPLKRMICFNSASIGRVYKSSKIKTKEIPRTIAQFNEKYCIPVPKNVRYPLCFKYFSLLSIVESFIMSYYAAYEMNSLNFLMMKYETDDQI